MLALALHCLWLYPIVRPKSTSVALADNRAPRTHAAAENTDALRYLRTTGVLPIWRLRVFVQFANASITPSRGRAVLSQWNQCLAHISTLISLPQIVVALIAPWAGGRLTKGRDRCFVRVGALTVRAIVSRLPSTWVPLSTQLLGRIIRSTLGGLRRYLLLISPKAWSRIQLAQGLLGVAVWRIAQQDIFSLVEGKLEARLGSSAFHV